jgi:hypothetical protein
MYVELKIGEEATVALSIRGSRDKGPRSRFKTIKIIVTIVL